VRVPPTSHTPASFAAAESIRTLSDTDLSVSYVAPDVYPISSAYSGKKLTPYGELKHSCVCAFQCFSNVSACAEPSSSHRQYDKVGLLRTLASSAPNHVRCVGKICLLVGSDLTELDQRETEGPGNNCGHLVGLS